MTKEEKYPINGYAPGNYFNVCHSCKEQFLGDKLAVTCKSCAIEAAYVYLTAENDLLREALALSKETIKLWACMGMSKSKEEETWRLYQNSPEMKRINQALKPDNSK